MDHTKPETDMYENIDKISTSISANHNFIKRELIIADCIKCCILYISGLADKNEIQELILKPLMCATINIKQVDAGIAEKLINKHIYCSEIKTTGSIEAISSELHSGNCAILVENSDLAIICNVSSSKYRTIQESTSEKAILGSRESFVEDLNLNIALIQRKIKNPDLKIERYIIGTKAKSEIALLYIENTIDSKVLSYIKKRMERITTPAVLSTGFLEQLLYNQPLNIFPMGKSTEKPDKVVFDLLEGKAALLISESSSVLIIPATFIEFFQGAEDYTEKTLLASFSRILRLIAVITVMFLEPVYLVLLYYNPELFPYKLITLIISSRQNIPLPPLLEIMSMDLAVEILREGGIRLPNPIGVTLAIVGGIVIGDSATKAGLVSDVTLFIVAITVISTFLIPNYQMALTVRFIRFPIMLLAQIFGFYGLLIGYYFLILALSKLDNFGVPYFSPLTPTRFTDLSDSFIRAPLKYVMKEPKSLKPSKKKLK